jgi:putative PIN family toxin of toxin-antitoxin system
MNIHAVIDTNIIISALLTSNLSSPTKSVINKVRDGGIIPMINSDIMEEYSDVLSRSKFRFTETDIYDTLNLFKTKGENYTPECLRTVFIDANDVIFYETFLMREDAYLITGNLRHFPSEPRILSPADMMHIIYLTNSLQKDMLNEPRTEYISEINQAKLQRAWEAIERMRASAIANGIADMPMEEIDEEIRQYREERRAKRF